ncbi:MAG: phosphate/phosphite/phosphonate ABC transporter substrate-binding protein [Candidatus Desulfatibia sp.]|uniref:substrate-binding domain-containing protein n=1 Tax=Candidatus Desulfatibia sp. TaxID=3101189 RepID=UPI002F2E5715
MFSARHVRSVLRLLIVLLLIFTHGCGVDADTAVVDFSKTVAIKQPGDYQPEQPRLKVAVAAMISPKETFTYYRQFLEYLGNQLDREIQLVQRKTYGEINTLFSEGEIDLGFICSGPYAAGSENYGFEALAVPQVRGSNFYQSYLIVHKDSRFQRLEDLRDGIFAFTDPESNTGRLVPVYWLQQQGETPGNFFKKSIYTYSHDNSILAVARKLVDAAAVDGHIWEYYHRRKPGNTSKTRIIKKSEQFGNPPVVVSSYLPTKLKERILQLLFSMHQNSEGKKILDELMIDRFIAPQEAWYDPIRQMKISLSLQGEATHANAKPEK